MRQIVLDTETTGLTPVDGHRIIEIGCVELVDRKLTENRFHVYLNPDREIDSGAIEVHGISNEFLQDKPRFKNIRKDFLAFIKDAELIIHNAPFDVGFIDSELARLGEELRVNQYCTVVDTLVMARKKHPGQRNSLDALCKRYAIDNSHRELHGALLDAEILAEVYKMMTGGQTSLFVDEDPLGATVTGQLSLNVKKKRPPLKLVCCNDEETRAHEKVLNIIDQQTGGHCLWKSNVGSEPVKN